MAPLQGVPNPPEDCSPPRRVDPRTLSILQNPMKSALFLDDSKTTHSMPTSGKTSADDIEQSITFLESTNDLLKALANVTDALLNDDAAPLSTETTRKIAYLKGKQQPSRFDGIVSDVIARPWTLRTSDLNELRSGFTQNDGFNCSVPQILHALLVATHSWEMRQLERVVHDPDEKWRVEIETADEAAFSTHDFNWTDHGYSLMDTLGMTEAATEVENKMKAVERLLESTDDERDKSEERRIWNRVLRETGIEDDEASDDGDVRKENETPSVGLENRTRRETVGILARSYATTTHVLRCVSTLLR